MSVDLSVSDNVSMTSQSNMTFSMEMDPDTNQHTRKYPSIQDYYKANSRDAKRPIQLQPGLSNYSSLLLGDDRISFNESILSASYRIPVEPLMAIDSPSKAKHRNVRMRDYQDATKKVGEFEINRLERVMKDKLFQRSYATSSPFQVRKAFKFFDREVSLKVSIEGFTRALEFLGFQFSELQNRALFARYDNNCTGEIDYMNFIQSAMFYPAVEPDFGVMTNNAPRPQTTIADAPDIEDSELKRLQEAELRSVFNKVDRARSGVLNKDDFELLLMALGHNLTQNELDACLHDIGVDAKKSEGSVSFDLFFEWWTDSMGMEAIRKKTSKNSKK